MISLPQQIISLSLLVVFALHLVRVHACLVINQPPVAIEEIERHIIEIAFEQKLVKAHKPNLRTGKKVAVVGSGPAGLGCCCTIELCRSPGYSL
jgi:NADPH-dependent glutamate synthase beta subunit-like oxidoreductase